MLKPSAISGKFLPDIFFVGLFLLLTAVFLAWKLSIFPVEMNQFLKVMSLGTAVCLLLLTAAVYLGYHYLHPLEKILASVALVVALLRLLELSFGGTLLEQFFVFVFGISLNDQNGAMSYLTSTCLTLLAVSILFGGDTKSVQGSWRHWFALILNFFLVFLVTVALSGYVLDLMMAYTWMGMRMSPHTGISLLVLSFIVVTMNFRLALDAIYKTGVKLRFLYGFCAVIIFGLCIFVVLQQQINYVNSVNQEIVNSLSSLQVEHLTELQRLSKIKYEMNELTLVLIAGFALISVILYSGIFMSLTHQLKKLSVFLVDSTNIDIKEKNSIPFLKDETEFGLIARSIDSFIDLNRSQQLLRLRSQKIIESMPNGVLIINQQGLIELANNQVCKIFEFSQEDLLGKPVEMLIPLDIVQRHPQDRENYFKNPEARLMGVELYGISKYGKEVALEIGLAPIDSEFGMQVLASIVDITERKSAAKNLALSREKVEVTSKALGIGIWEYYPGNNKLIWDETMCFLYGVRVEDFTGQYEFWRSRVHPDDIEIQEKQFLYSVNNNEEFTGSFRVVLPNHEVRYIQAKAKVEKDSHGLVHIIGTNFDVTREHMALKKIQQLDSLKASIVEYSQDAIVSKTLNGTVTSWNKTAENMFGFSAQEAIGTNIKNLIILSEHYWEHDELLKQVAQGEAVVNRQTMAKCKDGHIIDISVSLSPIKDEYGNIVSISSIKRDISESIKSANKLLEHQKELERSNKSLETFAYIASHDLKAPLRGISQLIGWLEEDIRDNKFETVPDTSQKIKSRIKRMEALLDDLLAYYRVEKMQGFYKIFDVRQSVIDIFHMNNNKPDLILDVDSDLPLFMTYVTPLEQVFANLISNAIKHHDRPKGVIKVSAKELDDAWYEFSVFDDGPGIDPKFHQRIFNLFQTLKPRDEVEGSGMGLALVKKIIEQYGGQIAVESESRGARFFFTWPKAIKKEINL